MILNTYKPCGRPRRFRLNITAAGLTLLCLFALQNCAEPLDLTQQDFMNFTNKLPFAFNTTIDTIAYMSCSQMGSDYNPQGFFTFRVGAYRANSGIRLSKDYRSATKGFAPSERAAALAESKINADAILQLSIRRRSNLQSMLTSSSSTSTLENEDHANILASLDSPAIAQRLVSLKEDQRIQYFPGIPGLGGQLLEGSMYFMDSEATEGSVRAHLRNSSLLTLTYADSSKTGDIAALAPDIKNPRTAYGKGYQVSFRIGPGVPDNPVDSSNSRPWYSLGSARVMNSIQERDLQGRPPKEAGLRSWSCPESYAFVIVRSADANDNNPATSDGTTCTRQADPLPSTLTETQRSAQQTIRHVLRQEDWWVDIRRYCVIPKQPSDFCYPKDSSATIDYDGGDCTENDSTCPHYVSVCVRQ